MSLTTTSTKQSYVGNGSTSTYAYTNFKVNSASEISVYVEDLFGNVVLLQSGVDYTANVVPESTGSITLASNLQNNFKLTIARVIPLTQTLDLRNQGDFYAEVHEDAFDKLVKIDQQQQEQISRSIKTVETDDSSVDLTIPSAEDRSNKFLSFDSSGAPVAKSSGGVGVVVVSEYAEKLLDDTTAAEFRTSLGFGSGQKFIVTSDIQDNSVDSSKLASDPSVDSNRSVSVNHIKNNAVTGVKIAEGAVAVEKFNGLQTTKMVVTPQFDYTENSATSNAHMQYPWSNPAKLSDPSTLPTDDGYGCAWSPSGEFLCVSHATSPFFSIYQRSGVNFVKLANPGTLPTGTGEGCAWSPNGEFLAIASTATPYIIIYQRNVSTFTKLTDPVTLPTGTVRSCVWSPNGELLVVGHDTSPYISIYQRSGTTFTKLSNPASLPDGGAGECSFSPSGDMFATSIRTGLGLNCVAIYQVQGNVFTKLVGAITDIAQANACAFSPDGRYLAVGTDVSPYLFLYERSGTTFTRLPDPSGVPTSEVFSVAWSASGGLLAYGTVSSPRIGIFSVSGGVFTKLSNPSVLPSSLVNGLSFSPSSEFLATAHVLSPRVTIYQTSSDMPDVGYVIINKVPRAGT